ncbi:PAP2-domain-containing protein [Marasmius fiardii PR-910]|nr:PAP2-domain-containing protein [Marasmius fiardii PR-910]
MPSDIPEAQMPWWLVFLDKTNRSVTVATFLVLTFTKSMGVAYFTAGATACSVAVKIVKKMVRQPRPVIDRRTKKVKKSYGMPSTHSAVIAFYMTYLLLACTRLPIHTSLPQSSLTRLIPPLICVPWGVMICVSRVWLGHHNWVQVLVGCGFGVVFSVGWFVAWVRGVNQYGQIAEHYAHEYIDSRVLWIYRRFISLSR